MDIFKSRIQQDKRDGWDNPPRAGRKTQEFGDSAVFPIEDEFCLVLRGK